MRPEEREKKSWAEDLRGKIKVDWYYPPDDWINAPDAHPCEDWGCEEGE